MTITDATTGAAIYYTTSGSTPTTSSTLYTGAIMVTSTETIEAFAVDSGYAPSAIVTATYTIAAPALPIGQWTWMGGSSTANSLGSYGILGVETASNMPSARYDSQSWVDASGNFWMYGGEEYMDGTALGDLWKFDTTTQEWVWTGGSQSYNASAVYGTVGGAAASNYPGFRLATVNWVDSKGNFWMLGGSVGANATNDLWTFNSTTKLWTWMGGVGTVNTYGVYGTSGVAAPTNWPGARSFGLSWTDSSGNLWMFGGTGSGATGTASDSLLNDLWKYNTATNQWTWFGGATTVNATGVYGALGVAAATNQPGARSLSVGWADASGNLWMFGGAGFDSTMVGKLNDLWRYNIASHQWTWMDGSNVTGALGVYGTQGVAASTNIPGAREFSQAWVDRAGNFWLFGGDGFYASALTLSNLNDVWEYMPATQQWVWMNGSNNAMVAPTNGTLGVSAAGNTPGGRGGMTGWVDESGNFWLFGGEGYTGVTTGPYGAMSDFWRYVP